MNLTFFILLSISSLYLLYLFSISPHSELKTLDTDMQTLVYENYNKFISATDTIREMKTKVESMEDEMSKLAQNMSSIAQCSATIHATLSKKHEQISKLSNVHSLLKKLQFLFELPSRLKKCMELKAYAPAVQYYVRASGVLQQVSEIEKKKQVW